MDTTFALKFGILAVAAISAWPAASEPSCRAVSPDYTVALVELYTSEGCDSCPPADRWLSALNLGGSPSRAAALAFHVDYWDRLGWTDRFGNADFTDRQYEQVRRHGSALAYTPQILLQGSDFAWRNAQPTAALAAINAKPARATIELAATPIGPEKVAVDVHVLIPEMRDRRHTVLDVALVQNGLQSEVKAGENAGKHLYHDHVVRAWRSGLAVGYAGELRQRVELPLPADRGTQQIVALVENTDNGSVLQALSLPLCNN